MFIWVLKALILPMNGVSGGSFFITQTFAAFAGILACHPESAKSLLFFLSESALSAFVFKDQGQIATPFCLTDRAVLRQIRWQNGSQ